MLCHRLSCRSEIYCRHRVRCTRLNADGYRLNAGAPGHCNWRSKAVSPQTTSVLAYLSISSPVIPLSLRLSGLGSSSACPTAPSRVRLNVFLYYCPKQCHLSSRLSWVERYERPAKRQQTTNKQIDSDKRYDFYRGCTLSAADHYYVNKDSVYVQSAVAEAMPRTSTCAEPGGVCCHLCYYIT